MAKFTAGDLRLKDGQKVTFGTSLDSNLWWDGTANELRLDTVISGVDPTQDYHLTTKQYVATTSGLIDHGALLGLTDPDHPAYAIYTNTATFSGILSSADTIVQKALETLDQYSAGAGGGGGIFQGDWVYYVNSTHPSAIDDTDRETPFITIQGAINAIPGPATPPRYTNDEQKRRHVILIASACYDEDLIISPAIQVYLFGMGPVILGDGVGEYYGSTIARTITWNRDNEKEAVSPADVRPILYIGTMTPGGEASSTHTAYQTCFDISGDLVVTLASGGVATTCDLHLQNVKIRGDLDGSASTGCVTNLYLYRCFFDNKFDWGVTNAQICFVESCEFDSDVIVRSIGRMNECEFDGNITFTSMNENIPPTGLYHCDLKSGITVTSASTIKLDAVTMNYWGGVIPAGGVTVELLEKASGIDNDSSVAGDTVKEALETLAASGVSDHGALTGLIDDDHTQYILVDGSRAFTGTVSGVTPTMPNHLTTKQYVDDAVYGLDWKDSVLDIVPIASGVQSTGNRYIASATGGGWTINQIYEWDGTQWVNDLVDEGAAAWVEDEDTNYVFNGTSWVKFGSTVTHNNLSGLQGGTGAEYYHLTSTMYTDLTSNGGVIDAGSQHHHDGRYYTETELDAGQLDNRYYTETEVDNIITTVSGDLQTNIDGKADIIHSHTSSDITDFNEAAQDAVGNIMSGAGSVTVTYDDGANTITVSGTDVGVTDHGALTGLADDDHTQYILVDGSRGFTATVSGVDPTQSYHLATKSYVDQGGIDRHGRQAVANAASTVTVSFADLGHTNYTVNATLENTTDSPPSIYAFIVSARTSSSFIVTMMGDTDSANYVLNWTVIED